VAGVGKKTLGNVAQGFSRLYPRTRRATFGASVIRLQIARCPLAPVGRPLAATPWAARSPPALRNDMSMYDLMLDALENA